MKRKQHEIRHNGGYVIASKHSQRGVGIYDPNCRSKFCLKTKQFQYVFPPCGVAFCFTEKQVNDEFVECDLYEAWDAVRAYFGEKNYHFANPSEQDKERESRIDQQNREIEKDNAEMALIARISEAERAKNKPSKQKEPAKKSRGQDERARGKRTKKKTGQGRVQVKKTWEQARNERAEKRREQNNREQEERARRDRDLEEYREARAKKKRKQEAEPTDELLPPQVGDKCDLCAGRKNVGTRMCMKCKGTGRIQPPSNEAFDQYGGKTHSVPGHIYRDDADGNRVYL